MNGDSAGDAFRPSVMGSTITPGVPVEEIFRDENPSKIQYLAAALADEAVPFRLCETVGGNVEVGWPEFVLTVAVDDVERAREVLLQAVAELPERQQMLAEAFPETDEEELPAEGDPPTGRMFRTLIVLAAVASIAAAVLGSSL